MGLDVYLKWYDDYDAVQAKESAASKKSEEIWAEYPKYDECTEEQKNEARDRIHEWNRDHGVDEWGSVDDEGQAKRIEEPSTIDPDHMFKIGYFRSSYNDGGLNSIMQEQLGGRDLYWVFQPPEDREYCFCPDWAIARGRINQLVSEWKEKLEDGCFSVLESRYNEFSGPLPESPIKTEEAALAAFEEEYKRFLEHSPGDVEYGPFEVLRVSFTTFNPHCQVGEKCEALEAYLQCRDVDQTQNGDLIFDEPVVVRGIVTGVREVTDMETALFNAAAANDDVAPVSHIPCTYYIISTGPEEGDWIARDNWDSGIYSNRNGEFHFGKNGFRVLGFINGMRQRFFVDEKLPATYAVYQNDSGFEWYFKALQIVAETCDWVMDQGDPEKYVLAWSS